MKPLTFSILRLLADGEFHSGEDMAQHLNVSRASIWNALQVPDDTGLQLYKVRGRGYRLAEPLQFLDRDSVLAALGDRRNLFEMDVHDAVESTNSMLLQKAALGAAHGSCVAAELQTCGRGRRGRDWHANLGGALTFSVLWRFNRGVGYLSGLSLAVGVALMRALRQAGVMGATLKWPNDVLHQYRKLAGILIEVQGDMLGPAAAVIGIGLNLKLSEQARTNIDQAVVDLHALQGGMPDRNQLLALLLSHLADVLQAFEESGFASLREEWLASHAYQDKQVRIMLPSGVQQEGYVLDVAEDGALLVKTSAGEQRFNSAEISLRGLD